MALAQICVDSPEGAPWWIHEWLVRSGTGDPSVHVALDTLAMVLSRPGLLDYQSRAQLYSSAKSAQLDHVAFLLLEDPPAVEREHEPERSLDPSSRPLTLGERKSLARGSQRDIIDKLATDPHPDVVAILLENPKLTEREVLRITSRRPVDPDTLMHVVMSERFRPRHAVRRSLCLNPHTPVMVAVRLMSTLRARDLRELGADRKLAAQLRLHAKALLDLRTERGLAATPS
jgi:hypothetical protein